MESIAVSEDENVLEMIRKHNGEFDKMRRACGDGGRGEKTSTQLAIRMGKRELNCEQTALSQESFALTLSTSPWKPWR